jgi:hypothetical protein
MSRRFKESAALVRAAVVFGVVGAACLTRPVVTSDPNLKTNFTNIIHSVAVDKLDVLFMIDNSASMGDKQQLLALAVPDMINRLVSPNCVDAMNNVIGPSTNGACTTGALEFPPVHDMHLGIVSSSLGGRGSSTTCSPSDPNPANTALNGHNDDHAYLIARGGANETPIAKAPSPDNFLAWYPNVAANMQPGAVAPPVPAETTVGDANTANTLIGDFTQMISGVHEHGCGFEAQNEAWYRFLVQPDPYQTINVDPGTLKASYVGVDNTILSQRAAFLRPDSLVAVIVVTDETQETANPISVGGLGYLFESSPWPSSPTTAAPEGTVECATNPNDPACVSCSIISPSASNFASQCPVDPPGGTAGYLDQSDDNINVRFFHQKQRFGVQAGYPSSRYITGLTSAKVPDSTTEEDGSGNYIGDQTAQLKCVNPLFAQNLPTDSTKELCHLEPGPRTPDLVYYALIGGVPHQFLQAAPGDPECSAGTAAADCPQKDTLTDADWLKITGADPENYNFSGADFHMLESETSRGPCDPTQGDTCDPINGREWDTGKKDLQYACIFDLPAPKDCTQMQFLGACDCAVGSNSANTPLCQKNGATYTTTQIKGKAYPTINELLVAHAMSAQGIVSSLCPIHPQPVGGAQDPVYGYRPAVNAIVNRLKNALSVQCLPQQLTIDPMSHAVPCLVLVTLPQQGNQDICGQTPGLGATPSDVLARFQAPAHAAWVQQGGASSGLPDPSSFPTCTINELTDLTDNAMDYSNGNCAMSANQGWCYVEGAAAGGSCTQQILFTSAMPPHGAAVNLQCIEQANGAIGNTSP